MKILYSQNKGFNLIELMVTLAVMAILVVMAAPSFGLMTQKTTLESSVNDFYSLLEYAKSEVGKRKKSIIICRAADTDTCAATWVGNRVLVKEASGTSILRAASIKDGVTINLATLSQIELKGDGTLANEVTLTFKNTPCKDGLDEITMKINRMGFITQTVSACNG